MTERYERFTYQTPKTLIGERFQTGAVEFDCYRSPHGAAFFRRCWNRPHWAVVRPEGRAAVARRVIPSKDDGEDLLPPLEGVELVGMSSVAFTLSGVEEINCVYFAQSLLVRQALVERQSDPLKMHPATRRRLGI